MFRDSDEIKSIPDGSNKGNFQLDLQDAENFLAEASSLEDVK